MGYTVILKKGEEKRILAGHGWVYANEAARIEGKDKNGSLAEVRAFDGRFVGKGYCTRRASPRRQNCAKRCSPGRIRTASACSSRRRTGCPRSS